MGGVGSVGSWVLWVEFWRRWRWMAWVHKILAWIKKMAGVKITCTNLNFCRLSQVIMYSTKCLFPKKTGLWYLRALLLKSLLGNQLGFMKPLASDITPCFCKDYNLSYSSIMFSSLSPDLNFNHKFVRRSCIRKAPLMEPFYDEVVIFIYVCHWYVFLVSRNF